LGDHTGGHIGSRETPQNARANLGSDSKPRHERVLTDESGEYPAPHLCSRLRRSGRRRWRRRQVLGGRRLRGRYLQSFRHPRRSLWIDGKRDDQRRGTRERLARPCAQSSNAPRGTLELDYDLKVPSISGHKRSRAQA
jgi:hypothetical protein